MQFFLTPLFPTTSTRCLSPLLRICYSSVRRIFSSQREEKLRAGKRLATGNRPKRQKARLEYETEVKGEVMVVQLAQPRLGHGRK